MKSTKSWILITWSMLSILPVDNAFAADVQVTPTILTAQFRINNKEIVSRTFTITGSSDLLSSRDEGNGKFVIEDNFRQNTFSQLGSGDGIGVYKLGLKLRNSNLSIRMVGRRLGHQFTIQGRYLNAKMQSTGLKYYIDNNGVILANEALSNGGDCTAVRPPQPSPATLVWEINNNSLDTSRNCTMASTGVWWYNRTGTVADTSLRGTSRSILLDIEALQNNVDYRKAPPDIYDGQVTSNSVSGFTVERWEQPNAYIMQYRTVVQLRKNPYFDSVTLPSGTHNFDVKTVSGQVRGNLTVPYVMNGQFTPYNTISLNVTSSNGFKLKDTNNNEIPYSLSTTIGVRKLNIANNGAVQNPASTITFTDLSKEFHALQGRFDADFSASTAIPTGTYTDTVTAVYTISL